MMNITQEQLAEIQVFIAAKGMVYKDVRPELLDHLACRLEAFMHADKTLAFHEALELAYIDFGGMAGFRQIEKSVKRSTEHRLFSIVREAASRWFSFPNMVLVMGFMYILTIIFEGKFEAGLWLLCGMQWGWTLNFLAKNQQDIAKRHFYVGLKIALSYTLLMPFLMTQIALASDFAHASLWATPLRQGLLISCLVLFFFFANFVLYGFYIHIKQRCYALNKKYGQ